MRYKFFLFMICLFLACSPVSAATTPLTITFEAKIATQQGGKLQGAHDVGISLVGQVLSNGVSREKVKWTDTIENVDFLNGVCSIVLGTKSTNPFEPSDFNITNPEFELEIDGMTARFPVPSTPYAVQASVAEEVALVRADRIVGSFTVTLNITNDLLVDNGTLYVDSVSNRVGINTTEPQYALDVAGVVNADSFQIDGKDIEAALSWRMSGDDLYYLDGNVGVGTSTPQYDLDVVGTINAREFFVDSQPLEEYLSTELAWKDGDGGSIYFNDGTSVGNIGIGTTNNLVERLTIDGGLQLGNSTQERPVAGTIEFDTTTRDFFGYTSDGQPYSLTGIRQTDTPESGQLAVWTGAKTVEGADDLYFSSGKLGVGTQNPTAVLHVKNGATSGPLFLVEDSSDQPAFYISDTGKIGIGTTLTTHNLQIDGVIDAQDYYINGTPLDEAFSEGSFWLKGNHEQVYYDLGNVGIGTTQPANLLELSAATGNEAAMTFDIEGTDLFTLGVGSTNPNAFVFSRGSDLTQPVFVFDGDKIGVGIDTPEANLHVSGNLGFLATGTYGSNTPLPATGTGTRLMWYPSKAAFRAGHVLGTNWDDDNIGDFSVAMGYDPVATGESSVVIGGYKGNASGTNAAVVGGFENTASGANSFAAGYKASAVHDGTFVWSD